MATMVAHITSDISIETIRYLSRLVIGEPSRTDAEGI
jgi:hypothetical protein